MKKDLDEFRFSVLAIAELFDAWRIVPRFLVGLYIVLISWCIHWYISVPRYEVRVCDEKVIQLLIDDDLSPTQIKTIQELYCPIDKIVGGPTTQDTILITTICGLATGIFGLYTSTGRDWSKRIFKWKTKDDDVNPT